MRTKLRCRVFGHKFPAVRVGGSIFKRVDCEREGCDYAMDAVAFKRTLDGLPEGLREHVARKGPRFLDSEEDR